MIQPSEYDVIVVGAGPGGGSAGIRLAAAGFRTLVLEQHRYPAPKLCGEFLSMEASQYLADLGVLDRIRDGPHAEIGHVYLSAPGGGAVRRELPGTALGVARHRLDAVIFSHAVASGADCEDGTHVESIAGSLEKGFAVQAAGRQRTCRVVIGAYGKRSALDKNLGRRVRRTDVVAFRWKFAGSADTRSVEIYGFDGGYIGLCPVGAGVTNACLVARESALAQGGQTAEGLLGLAQRQNGALRERLSECGTRETKALGCSSISFRLKSKFEADVCMVGDTAGMIAPLCGDGMSMAMRSAELAAAAAGSFLRGECDAGRFRREYARSWDREFLPRLATGRALQSVAVSPVAAGSVVRLCSAAPALVDLLIKATRQKHIAPIPQGCA